MLKRGLEYVFLNNFVNRIPFWTIRRILYKMFGLKLGEDARIGLFTTIISPKNITIGKRSVVNEFCLLDGSGGIEIKDDVSISTHAKIFTSTHDIDSIKFDYCSKKVIIEKNVWIGACAIILDGSILKRGSIIAAGTVFKNLAYSNKVYCGNPAKFIKDRNLFSNYEIDYHPYFR